MARGSRPCPGSTQSPCSTQTQAPGGAGRGVRARPAPVLTGLPRRGQVRCPEPQRAVCPPTWTPTSPAPGPSAGPCLQANAVPSLPPGPPAHAPPAASPPPATLLGIIDPLAHVPGTREGQACARHRLHAPGNVAATGRTALVHSLSTVPGVEGPAVDDRLCTPRPVAGTGLGLCEEGDGHGQGWPSQGGHAVVPEEHRDTAAAPVSHLPHPPPAKARWASERAPFP